MEPSDPLAVLQGHECCLSCFVIVAVPILAVVAAGILLTYFALEYTWAIGLVIAAVILLAVFRKLARR